MDDKVKLLAKHTPVEGNAIEQLKQTASLPGVIKAVGLPDLHMGKGCPIGAAILTQGVVLPYLVGGDIGCGMSLGMTDLKVHKTKRDKLVKKIGSLESGYEGDIGFIEQALDIKLDRYTSALGTIGGGNHFCEVLSVEEIQNQTLFDELGLDKSVLYVMTHSGSRGLGESILREHTDKFKSAGLLVNTPEYDHYIKEHNYAIQWAKANRMLITQKVKENLNTEVTPVLDIFHNFVEITPSGLLHRKGSAPSDKGLVVIPGSRGDFTYLVKPILQDFNLNSLAHGAGRKWQRGESKGRLSGKYRPDDLLITDLKSQVICEDKDLLYEEAPENYKKITKVISDLVELKLIEVIAVLRPVVTYKKKRLADECDHD
jgi:release factor H-coupled RctB family protein